MWDSPVIFPRGQLQAIIIGHRRVKTRNSRVTQSKPILDYIHSHHGYINYGIIGLINVGLNSHFSQAIIIGHLHVKKQNSREAQSKPILNYISYHGYTNTSTQ